MNTTGKLQTGHFITTGIEKNIDTFVQDMETVVTKFSATFPISSTAKSSKSRKSCKKAVPKPIGTRFMLQRLERRELVSYVCLWGAHQLTMSMIH